MKLRILKWVSAALRVNPYLLFYYQLGIFNYKNLEDSGEEFFIKSILKKLYKKGHNLVLLMWEEIKEIIPKLLKTTSKS